MRRDDVAALIDETRHPDARVRRRALRDLCPCEVRANVGAVWDRVLEMREDPDERVRSLVLHTLCDGSPADRRDEVVAAVEALGRDPDERIRRRARGVIAAYRRTGRINQL